MDAATVTVVLACAVVAALGTIGADARWLAALGRAIDERGAIPHGVPFATAPSADWPNVPVLAELLLRWLNAAFGDSGFLLAQVLAVAGGLGFVVADMRRARANELASALVLVLILFGAASSLIVIRAQLFSLVLFPALVLLLRSEARSPSRRVWLVPLVLALWSNLHGAVLVGFAVSAIYLVISRARQHPLNAAGVLVASAFAICATPALERTPKYYVGVLQNEAARRAEGLWAALTWNSGVDRLLIATGIVLILLALWSRPALWEILALAALAIVTVRTARSGVWLLFFAAPPAAQSLRLRLRLSRPWPMLLSVGLSLVAVYGITRGPDSPDASDRVIAETLKRAGTTPVLAESRFAEQLALAGGRVWMSNPLDAFPRHDQQLYLDWLDGRPTGVAAFAHAPRAVLVRRGSPSDLLAAARPDLHAETGDVRAVLYVRNP